jgi:hypothetical protein
MSITSRFGRNKPLPRRPPVVPRQEEMQAALKDIRRAETFRFGEAVQIGADFRVFLIYCVAWAGVAGGIVALFLVWR